MLQQTRVAAVIPYYRALPRSLPGRCGAGAALQRLNCSRCGAAWVTIRAHAICKRPRGRSWNPALSPAITTSILGLAGVGTYTAQPSPAFLSGCRTRWWMAMSAACSRAGQMTGTQTRSRSPTACSTASDPARWNQAVMELGATICLPREPLCGECPVAAHCASRRAGTQHDLPLKRSKPAPEDLERTLLVICRRGRILLTPSPRVKGFWDLPEHLANVRIGATLGEFRHTITHRHYRFTVKEAIAGTVPKGTRWHTEKELGQIPLSTTARKALRIYNAG